MIRPAWLRRPELVKRQHWQSMRREKHAPVLNEQLLKKETPQNVGTQNRKKKEPEPLDGARSGWLPQPAWVDSEGVHAHISPHSTVRGGGRGLSENHSWSQQANSKSKIITHAFLTPSPPWLCCCPKPPVPPSSGWSQQGEEVTVPCKLLEKIRPQVSRKKGHSLFTLLC